MAKSSTNIYLNGAGKPIYTQAPHALQPPRYDLIQVLRAYNQTQPVDSWRGIPSTEHPKLPDIGGGNTGTHIRKYRTQPDLGKVSYSTLNPLTSPIQSSVPSQYKPVSSWAPRNTQQGEFSIRNDQSKIRGLPGASQPTCYTSHLPVASQRLYPHFSDPLQGTGYKRQFIDTTYSRDNNKGNTPTHLPTHPILPNKPLHSQQKPDSQDNKTQQEEKDLFDFIIEHTTNTTVPHVFSEAVTRQQNTHNNDANVNLKTLEHLGILPGGTKKITEFKKEHLPTYIDFMKKYAISKLILGLMKQSTILSQQDTKPIAESCDWNESYINETINKYRANIINSFNHFHSLSINESIVQDTINKLPKSQRKNIPYIKQQLIASGFNLELFMDYSDIYINQNSYDKQDSILINLLEDWLSHPQSIDEKDARSAFLKRNPHIPYQCLQIPSKRFNYAISMAGLHPDGFEHLKPCTVHSEPPSTENRDTPIQTYRAQQNTGEISHTVTNTPPNSTESAPLLRQEYTVAPPPPYSLAVSRLHKNNASAEASTHVNHDITMNKWNGTLHLNTNNIIDELLETDVSSKTICDSICTMNRLLQSAKNEPSELDHTNNNQQGSSSHQDKTDRNNPLIFWKMVEKELITEDGKIQTHFQKKDALIWRDLLKKYALSRQVIKRLAESETLAKPEHIRICNAINWHPQSLTNYKAALKQDISNRKRAEKNQLSQNSVASLLDTTHKDISKATKNQHNKTSSSNSEDHIEMDQYDRQDSDAINILQLLHDYEHITTFSEAVDAYKIMNGTSNSTIPSNHTQRILYAVKLAKLAENPTLESDQNINTEPKQTTQKKKHTGANQDAQTHRFLTTHSTAQQSDGVPPDAVHNSITPYAGSQQSPITRHTHRHGANAYPVEIRSHNSSPARHAQQSAANKRTHTKTYTHVPEKRTRYQMSNLQRNNLVLDSESDMLIQHSQMQAGNHHSIPLYPQWDDDI